MRYPYDDLTQSYDDYRNNAEHRFEEKVVGQLLTAFKLTKFRLPLIGDQRDLTGEGRLTLDCFFARFQPPVYLAVSKFGYVVENNSQADMFSTFGSRSYTKRFQEMDDNLQNLEVPLGLVFPWPGLAGGHILHNGERNTDDDGVFTCWRSGDRWLVLEPFATYLHNLRRHWRPELD